MISTDSSVGVNIDNGQIPQGLFDVQTFGGVSRLTVTTAGDVGIGTNAPVGRFDVQNTSGTVNILTLPDTGKLSVKHDICLIGTNTYLSLVSNLSSSKYLKDIYSPVDGADILEKVSSLPISIWSYKNDEDSVLHIGPMAEDFQAIFGLNGDITDKIAIVDGLGVALTSIQVLHSELKQKDIEIQQLKQDVADIKNILLEH